jgi:muramidase (phage lysozyme)
MNQNRVAFLDMIAMSEGTARAPDPYRCCYAYKHTVQDLAYHPAEFRPPNNLREWKGEPLDSLGPAYVGDVSTAAGRYQITIHTWRALEGALNLPDFGPASQDAAAVLLIKQKGALDMVDSGRVVDAVNLCHVIWASLPGSTSGQPQTAMAELVKTYTGAGGAFA